MGWPGAKFVLDCDRGGKAVKVQAPGHRCGAEQRSGAAASLSRLLRVWPPGLGNSSGHRAVPRPTGLEGCRGRGAGIRGRGLTGAGIAHQIGLGALIDGYAACRTQFLPFCF